MRQSFPTLKIIFIFHSAQESPPYIKIREAFTLHRQFSLKICVQEGDLFLEMQQLTSPGRRECSLSKRPCRLDNFFFGSIVEDSRPISSAQRIFFANAQYSHSWIVLDSGEIA